MQILERELCEKTETTWEVMLGLNISPCPYLISLDSVENFLTGKVEIWGEWNGVVVVHGSLTLAKSVASHIFSPLEVEPTYSEQLDAMYELTSMMGRNILSVVPGPSHVSLPSVQPTTQHDLFVPRAEKVSAMTFVCQNQPLFLTLWNGKHEGKILRLEKNDDENE